VLWHLKGKPDYAFTQDFVSQHIPVWQEYLAEFRGKENIHLLEIGSFQGRSAAWFLDNILTHPSASITCLDPFTVPGNEPRFDHNVEVSGSARKVTKIRNRSEEVLYALGEERFDIIYIDGNHHAVNVFMDAMLSWSLLKPGGVIIFDDYAWHPNKPPHKRPQMAIDLFLKTLHPQIMLLHKGYQVIIKKLVATEPLSS
jgi:predicted O-methyltransferase YrrM